MDPTVGMLRRLLFAAGGELEMSLRRPGAARTQLADQHDAWRSTSSGDRPDWTRLRAFVAHLRCTLTQSRTPSGAHPLRRVRS